MCRWFYYDVYAEVRWQLYDTGSFFPPQCHSRDWTQVSGYVLPEPYLNITFLLYSTIKTFKRLNQFSCVLPIHLDLPLILCVNKSVLERCFGFSIKVKTSVSGIPPENLRYIYKEGNQRRLQNRWHTSWSLCYGNSSGIGWDIILLATESSWLITIFYLFIWHG